MRVLRHRQSRFSSDSAIPYTQLQFQLTTQISEYKLSKAQKLAYECVRKKYKGC